MRLLYVSLIDGMRTEPALRRSRCQFGFYTILPIPILYVEWQNRRVGGMPYIAQY